MNLNELTRSEWYWAISAYTLFLIGFTVIWQRLAVNRQWYALSSGTSAKVITTFGVLFLMAAAASFLGGTISGSIFLATMLLTLTGLLDDIIGLPIVLRLFIHVAAGILLVDHFGWGPLWGLTLFLSVVFMNVFNFMDGANGILGLYGLAVVGGSLFLMPESQMFYSWSMQTLLIIALLVFLWGNFRNNALWMAGDTGSIPLGFIVFYILFQAVRPVTLTDYLPVLLCSALFLTDAGATLVTRLVNRENVFKRHQKHVYQQAVAVVGVHPLLIAGAFALLQFLEIIILKSTLRSPVFSFTILLFNLLLWLIFSYFIARNKSQVGDLE